MTEYASGTTVTPERSQTEIAQSLRRYGASGFIYGEDEGTAFVMFKARQRTIQFTVPLPTNLAPFRRTPTGRARTDAKAREALEGEIRRLWRALALAIKAKLEVVASGIATFEEEFAMHTVMPDGRVLAEHVMPKVEAAIADGLMPTRMLAITSGVTE